MEEKYYGILMHRVCIGEDIYVFKPKGLVEGTLCADEYDEEDFDEEIYEEEERYSFIDENNCEYFLATNPYSLGTDEDMVVGYEITEKDLLEKYKGFSLDDAKQAYLDQIFSSIHLGCLIYDEGKIVITPTNIQDYVYKLNYEEEFDFNAAQVDNENIVQIEINGDCIFIGEDIFKSLLEIDDLIELKKKLNEIYDNSKNLFDELNQNESGIKKLFNDVYDTMLTTDNLTDMKNLLKNVEDTYIEMILELDDKKEEGYDTTEALDLLYSISEEYHRLINLDNLDEIKEGITKLKIKEEKRINNLDFEEYLNNLPATTVEKEEVNETEEVKTKFDIREIKKHFDERIIGQEEAKKDVISAIYMNKLVDDPANKNNCLLVGPTGSGKTLIAETVADYFDMPIEIIDTTQLTVPGYVGANIEDFLERLVAKTKGDLKKAEEGIVVFDEIDKKGSNDNGDISGKGVLNTLLPFIGGTTYDIKYNNRLMHFNTSKLTIFATGAFTDANTESKSTDYSSTKIGFGSEPVKKDEDIKYKKLDTDDFVKNGKMPAELIGRFSVITQLSGHTIESLRSILTSSDRSALLSEQKKLSQIGVELKWTDGYLDAVSKKAIELKTGARSLKSTVDKSVKEVRWEVINNLDIYKAIILTEKTVEDNLDCELIDINGISHNLKEIISAKDKTNLVLVKK